MQIKRPRKNFGVETQECQKTSFSFFHPDCTVDTGITPVHVPHQLFKKLVGNSRVIPPIGNRHFWLTLPRRTFSITQVITSRKIDCLREREAFFECFSCEAFRRFRHMKYLRYQRRHRGCSCLRFR